MDIHKAKTVYCIGIGGIGVSALARILHARGKQVTGSDATESHITRDLGKSGITIEPGDTKTLPENTDLVIYSGAVPEQHPQRQLAKNRNIPQIVYPQALGQLLKTAELSIAVSGTNGKTTTTAMIGLILEHAGFDPTVVVGSVVKQWGSNARVGGTKVTVVEACEHQAAMLHLQPHVIVLTNIEADHLDYYKDLDHIVQTFQRYISTLPSHGWLFLNADDAVSSSKLKPPKTQVRTYGLHKPADVMAKNAVYVDGRHSFEWWFGKKYVDDINLHIPGEFNISNALAAMSASVALGVEPVAIKQALEQFRGTWRRFEKLGTWHRATVISDYAHHPTAIAATLQAAKELYANRRIVAVFEPHQRNRTKNLLPDFAEALKAADVAIVSEIFEPAGREEESDVSAEDIVTALVAAGRVAVYARNLEQAEAKLSAMVQANDVILLMGAGPIYTLAEKLCRPSD